MQGFHSGTGARVLVIGATNRPWDLDDGAVRRFEQRIYVPLPDVAARQAIFRNMLQHLGRHLTDTDYAHFAACTEGYSGADVAAVVRAAAMLPLAPLIDACYVAPDADGSYRASSADAPGSVAIDAAFDLSHLNLYDDVGASDVLAAMARFRPSVQLSTLQQFAAYEASSQEH